MNDKLDSVRNPFDRYVTNYRPIRTNIYILSPCELLAMNNHYLSANNAGDPTQHATECVSLYARMQIGEAQARKNKFTFEEAQYPAEISSHLNKIHSIIFFSMRYD